MFLLSKALGWDALSDKLLCFLLPALFFVTPLSSSAKSIFIVLAVLTIIASPRCRQQLMGLLTYSWCRWALALFALALLGCLWSSASLAEKGLVLEKWSKLLYLPILIVGFQHAKTARHAMQAFLMAMLLTCVLSIVMKYTGMFTGGKITAESIFRNHIMTGIMMSFAVYLSGIFFFRAQGKVKFIYLLLALILSYQVLFISESRTGYIVYILLMGILMVQMLSKRAAILGVLLVGSLFLSCFYLSKPMQNGMQAVISNLRVYDHNQKDTSVGYRLQFHDYAKQLFLRHPLIGGGTGSFTYHFRVENPIPAWTNWPEHSGRLLEPHSQYWLVAAEFGALGLMLLALFYLSLFITAHRLHALRPVAYAMLIIFMLGNLSDSLLFYSGSGYFFILFLALCFSEKRYHHVSSPAQAFWSKLSTKPSHN